MLPEVLIVKLQRYQKNQFNRIISKNCTDIDPSVILQLDQTDYMLNAVVTHYGRHTNEGHYITTLYQDGQWIDCNDEVVRPTNDVPEMGYLFFYDRVNQTPLALQSVTIGSTNVGIPFVTDPLEEISSKQTKNIHSSNERVNRYFIKS